MTRHPTGSYDSSDINRARCEDAGSGVYPHPKLYHTNLGYPPQNDYPIYAVHDYDKISALYNPQTRGKSSLLSQRPVHEIVGGPHPGLYNDQSRPINSGDV
jgi:hypothetical protein